MWQISCIMQICRIMFCYVLFIFVPQMMYRNQRLTVTFSILSCICSWAQTKVSECRKPRLQMATFSRDDHHGPLLYLRPAGFVRKVVGKRSLRIFGRYCLNIVIVMYWEGVTHWWSLMRDFKRALQFAVYCWKTQMQKGERIWLPVRKPRNTSIVNGRFKKIHCNPATNHVLHHILFESIQM